MKTYQLIKKIQTCFLYYYLLANAIILWFLYGMQWMMGWAEEQYTKQSLNQQHWLELVHCKFIFCDACLSESWEPQEFRVRTCSVNCNIMNASVILNFFSFSSHGYLLVHFTHNILAERCYLLLITVDFRWENTKWLPM